MSRSNIPRLSRLGALLVLLLLPTSAPARDARTLLEEVLPPAIAEYERALTLSDRDARLEGFERARLQFQRAIREGTAENADLWTNLGNAALGGESLGVAIHAYRTALRLDPDHRRAGGNLAHARRLLPDWVPTPAEGGALDTFLFWAQRLSSAERGILAAGALLIAALLLPVGIARRRGGLRTLAVLPLLVGVALLLTGGGTSLDTMEAVIIVEDTVARAADSRSAPAKFSEPLPDGVEVTILEEREGWRRVGLSDGRDAWVPTASVARLGELP
ncbi:MAG: tetratricopeptide repeat protein [Planctomycetota bacterium]